MVAKVTVPHSIKRALNYNEQKAQKGQAECLYANGFLKEAGNLNFYEKLERFEKLNELNQRATTNTLHVSLNFDPSEKLSKEQMIAIAKAYMEKMGFGDQPYLVYVHHDAGHPHIHIVSTAIKKDGKRISLHNIGRNQSTVARKEIEKEFNLVRAEDQPKKKQQKLDTPAQKVKYGKAETKRAITNVLDAVLDKYKFTSLEELNAILKQYNVVADRGSKGSIIYQKGGLVFRVLDENGKKVGVPVKASKIYSQPTLKNLEKKFEANKILREPHKKTLKTKIDWIMLQKPKSMEDLQRLLQQEKITLVIRQNEEGRVYGLTYIDNNTKCVFNGSDLGKGYSAKAMLEKLEARHQAKEIQQPVKEQPTQTKQPNTREVVTDKSQTIFIKKDHSQDVSMDQKHSTVLDELTRAEQSFGVTPYGLRKKRKQKRKRL